MLKFIIFLLMLGLASVKGLTYNGSETLSTVYACEKSLPSSNMTRDNNMRGGFNTTISVNQTLFNSTAHQIRIKDLSLKCSNGFIINMVQATVSSINRTVCDLVDRKLINSSDNCSETASASLFARKL